MALMEAVKTSRKASMDQRVDVEILCHFGEDDKAARIAVQQNSHILRIA